jgi:hypothetical protein
VLSFSRKTIPRAGSIGSNDFTKSLALEANVFYCVAGKVNSADKLYLVIESVKRDTKHAWSSTAHAPVDGAKDSTMF